MASSRSAEVYADFLLPHLAADAHLVDVGCGSGELSLDLAPLVGRLTGVDDDPAEVAAARAAAAEAARPNASFVVGDAYSLPLPDDAADAVLAHSVLEAVDRPLEVLTELRRVLRSSGVVAVASVEYGGLVLAGPHASLTRRFFDLRQRLWLAEGADPFRGRELRGLLRASGFTRVRATTTSISYGTEETVREFGLGRAADCLGEWYVDGARREGLATRGDLTALHDAWLEWAESPRSYAAFAWCRALGWKR
jgi:ubiquinone/menaquinone biosynthesis C-methylase UbiE